MNSNRILTRKIMGLDRNVWWSLFTMIFVSAFLLSYKMMDSENCTTVSVTVKTIIHHEKNEYYCDEIISFNAVGTEKMLTWDFNDNSPAQEGRYTTHRFKNEGKYNIRITTRAGCETIEQVTIVKSPVSQAQVEDNKEEKISGHTSTLVGAMENFYSLVKADSYEWNVLQHPKYLPRTGDSTKYTFLEPGDYIIELTLNNDRSKKFLKTIHVDDLPRPKTEAEEKIVPLITADMRNVRRPDTANGQKNLASSDKPQDNIAVIPPKTEPLKKKTTFVANETFFNFLQDLVDDKRDINDFNQYLSEGGATKVQVNGDKDFKTFAWLVQEFKGKKKIKLKSVELIRDENENVFNIKVSYKKKGIFGL